MTVVVSTELLLAGIAELIDLAGIGVYDVDRTWTKNDTEFAVVMGRADQDPPNVIVLTPYAVRDDPRLNDTTAGVQMRIRGGPDAGPVYAINDALFALFEGRHDETMNGVPVVLCWRQSSLPAGWNSNQQYEHTANWYWQVAWPTTYRTD